MLESEETLCPLTHKKVHFRQSSHKENSFEVKLLLNRCASRTYKFHVNSFYDE